MTKIEELRNHILNATCSGDLPDTTLATFDDMVEAVEFLQYVQDISSEDLNDLNLDRLNSLLEKLR